MAANTLIDTSAMLAILDRDDAWHRPCSEAYLKFQLPLLTSQAALTELFHLLQRTRTDMEHAWKLFSDGTVRMVTIENQELSAIHALMSKYRDHPMDFADATLVYLAERESLNTIFTVDSDFETYRIRGTRRFRIVPSK